MDVTFCFSIKPFTFAGARAVTYFSGPIPDGCDARELAWGEFLVGLEGDLAGDGVADDGAGIGGAESDSGGFKNRFGSFPGMVEPVDREFC